MRRQLEHVFICEVRHRKACRRKFPLLLPKREALGRYKDFFFEQTKMNYEAQAGWPVTFVCFTCLTESRCLAEDVKKTRLDSLLPELHHSQLCRITIVDTDEPLYSPTKKTLYTIAATSTSEEDLEKFASEVYRPFPTPGGGLRETGSRVALKPERP